MKRDISSCPKDMFRNMETPPGMVKSSCLVVPLRMGEVFRRRLLELGLLDTCLKIQVTGKRIYLPLKAGFESRVAGLAEELARGLKADGQKVLTDMEVSSGFFERLPQRGGNLESRLGFRIGYEVVGSLAILISPLEGEEAERAACALLEERNVKTVLRPVTPVEGEYRTRGFRVLGGVNTTETVYREHGCTFKFDLAGVYFSPRLSTERMRIASQIRAGETVVDMFAGVGPFSIVAARKNPDARLIAVDKNPLAVKYLRENIALNHLSNVEVLEGDTRELAEKLENTANRLIMNHPHYSHLFLDAAKKIACSSAVVHFYTFSDVPDRTSETPWKSSISSWKQDLFREAVKTIRDKLPDRKITVLDKRAVRSYAPYQYNICIEFRMEGG